MMDKINIVNFMFMVFTKQITAMLNLHNSCFSYSSPGIDLLNTTVVTGESWICYSGPILSFLQSVFFRMGSAELWSMTVVQDANPGLPWC